MNRQLTKLNDYTSCVSRINSILGSIISPLEVQDDKAKQLITSLVKEINKVRSASKDLQTSVHNFASPINDLHKGLSQISKLVQGVLQKKTLKLGDSYFDFEIKKLQNVLSDYEEQLKSFKKQEDFIVKQERDKLTDLNVDIQEHFPNDTSLIHFSGYSQDQLILDHKQTTNFMTKLAELKVNSFQRITDFEIKIQANTSMVQIKTNSLQLAEELASSLEDSIKELKNAITDKEVTLNEITVLAVESYKQEHERFKKINKEHQTLLHNNVATANQAISVSLQELSSVKLNNREFHYILVLDDSGSMQGSFKQVKQAVDKLVEQIKAQSPNSIMSIIIFNSTARCIYQAKPVTGSYNIEFSGGGTNYANAFKEVQNQLEFTSPQQIPIVVFMTDGEDSVEKPKQILTECYSKISKASQNSTLDRYLYTFCVGYGRDIKKETLEVLCRAGNNGKISREICGTNVPMLIQCSQDSSDLEFAFRQISTCFNPQLLAAQQKQGILAVQRERALNDLKLESDNLNKNIQHLEQQFQIRNKEYLNNQLQSKDEAILEIEKQIKMKEAEKVKLQQQIELDTKKIAKLQAKIEEFKKGKEDAENMFKSEKEKIEQKQKTLLKEHDLGLEQFQSDQVRRQKFAAIGVNEKNVEKFQSILGASNELIQIIDSRQTFKTGVKSRLCSVLTAFRNVGIVFDNIENYSIDESALIDEEIQQFMGVEETVMLRDFYQKFLIKNGFQNEIIHKAIVAKVLRTQLMALDDIKKEEDFLKKKSKEFMPLICPKLLELQNEIEEIGDQRDIYKKKKKVLKEVLNKLEEEGADEKKVNKAERDLEKLKDKIAKLKEKKEKKEERGENANAYERERELVDETTNALSLLRQYFKQKYSDRVKIEFRNHLEGRCRGLVQDALDNLEEIRYVITSIESQLAIESY